MSLATAVPMSNVAVLSRPRHQKRFRSYFLESPIGVFGIMRDPASPDRWNLYLGSKRFARFESAEEAIRAVEDRNTGLPDWDTARDAASGLGIFEWKTI